jgi:hypothetical protein
MIFGMQKNKLVSIAYFEIETFYDEIFIHKWDISKKIPISLFQCKI